MKKVKAKKKFLLCRERNRQVCPMGRGRTFDTTSLEKLLAFPKKLPAKSKKLPADFKKLPAKFTSRVVYRHVNTTLYARG